MPVDRIARNEIIELADRLLGESITFWEFAERVNEIGERTQDPTARFVLRVVEEFYDDFDDRPTFEVKSGWDCLQRFLLVLHSDAQIVKVRSRHWHRSQLLAVRLLGLGATLIGWLGVGAQMLLALIPLGIGSIWLSLWRRGQQPRSDWDAAALYPFASWSELRAVVSSVPDFRKRRFVPKQPTRRWFPRLMNFEVGVWPLYPFWVLFSPIVVLFQTLPRIECESHVVLPEV